MALSNIRGLLFLASVGVLLATGAPRATAAWNEPVAGPVDQATQAAGDPDVADVAGTPWVVWVEGDEEVLGQIRAARMNASGAWEEVGGVLNLDAARSAIEPTIAAVGGRPWIAWSEDDGVNEEIRVARLNSAGTDWNAVGSGASPVNANPAHQARAPQLAAVDGVAHLAWREFDGVNWEVRVAAFDEDDDDWVPRPSGPSPVNHDATRDALDPQLARVGERACLSWREEDGVNFEARAACAPQGRVGPGTKWPELGGGESPLNVDDERNAVGTAIVELDGVPLVAWAEEDSDTARRDLDKVVRVARFGTGEGPWQLVGPKFVRTTEDPSLSLIVAAGQPWLAFHEAVGGIDNFGGSRLRVLRFDASPDAGSNHAWVGQPLNQGPAWGGSLTTIRGIPWLAWEEAGTGDVSQVRVSRLEPEFLGQSASPTADGAVLSAEVRAFGLPYDVGFDFGPSFGARTATATTTGETATISAAVSGVPPGTTVDWRPFALAGVPAPRVLGPASTFTTPAAPPSDLGPPAAPPTPPIPPAPGPPTPAPLTIEHVKKAVRVVRGRRVTVRFVLNRAAKVTLVIRRGKRRVRRLTVDGRAGMNRIRVRAPKRAGRHSLTLVARAADGATARARARLRVVARGGRRSS